MKVMKKIMALVIAGVMTFGAANMVMADATTAHTITITNDNYKGAHTFTAYQVFAGNYIEEGAKAGQLQEITWGAGVNGTALLAALKADETIGNLFKDATDAVTAAAAIGNMTSNTEQVEKLAEIIAANLTDTSAGTASGDSSLSISVTGDGYYFVKDTTENMPEGDSYSAYVLQVVHDVTAAAKSETVTSDKEIKDTNDSQANSTTDWQKTSDYDIGDNVPYRLTGTLPANYDKYDTYKYVFHDKESKGLTFNNDVKVYVGQTELTSGYTVVTEGLEDDCTFEVRFDNLKQITSITKDSTIYVEYSSQLNSDAVIGNPGNPNESWLEYSNNPNAGGDGETGTTPHKTVVTFTYKVVVNKVDENEEPLKGAGFTLYKKNNAGTYEVVKTIETADLTTFSFEGLDDGDYKLEESKVPTGYNQMADVEFSIVAEHDTLITKLNGVESTGEIDLGTSQKAAVTTNDGSITSDIMNQSGATLPSTGGIGTTIFYVIGAILVLGAGIILVSKKRMSVN